MNSGEFKVVVPRRFRSRLRSGEFEETQSRNSAGFQDTVSHGGIAIQGLVCAQRLLKARP